ncbi:hypothetical protein V6N12_042668 [Hibiscus sabdariffa]|uniref:Uncharacterized protein n=1 Tax=Hibiscus sabdariffa TaxID=183260 RepID=A0ABR2AL26_9ROSI
MGKDGDKNLVVPETTVHDEASCFETNLYGPWMLVGPRRRRNPNNTRNEDGLNEKRNQTGGVLIAQTSNVSISHDVDKAV